MCLSEDKANSILTLKTPVQGHIINNSVKFDPHWFEIALFITLKPNNALIIPDDFNDVFYGNYVEQEQEQRSTPKYPQLPRCVHAQRVETVKHSGPWGGLCIDMYAQRTETMKQRSTWMKLFHGYYIFIPVVVYSLWLWKIGGNVKFGLSS